MGIEDGMEMAGDATEDDDVGMAAADQEGRQGGVPGSTSSNSSRCERATLPKKTKGGKGGTGGTGGGKGGKGGKGGDGAVEPQTTAKERRRLKRQREGKKKQPKHKWNERS